MNIVKKDTKNQYNVKKWRLSYIWRRTNPTDMTINYKLTHQSTRIGVMANKIRLQVRDDDLEKEQERN